MEKITVSKAALIAKMIANRDTHRTLFLEALDGYRQEALAALERQVKDIRNGKITEVGICISPPADHTRDYDRVIAMLEMHTGSEFTLTEQDFAQYALDDWAWKRQWGISNAGYVSGKTLAEYADYFA